MGLELVSEAAAAATAVAIVGTVTEKTEMLLKSSINDVKGGRKTCTRTKGVGCRRHGAKG